MAKSERLIPLIIEAKDKDAATAVLWETLKELHLTSDYTDLVALKEKLDSYKSLFKKVSDEYRALVSPRSLDDIQYYRLECNFLYRDINDELTFDINRLKIYYEEYKTVQRFESMENVRTNNSVTENYKAKSASALRDIVGADPKYTEFTSLASVSYGLWSQLSKLLESIKLLTDSLAAESRRASLIETKDVR
jgi:hypothetical protein